MKALTSIELTNFVLPSLAAIAKKEDLVPMHIVIMRILAC